MSTVGEGSSAIEPMIAMFNQGNIEGLKVKLLDKDSRIAFENWLSDQSPTQIKHHGWKVLTVLATHASKEEDSSLAKISTTLHRVLPLHENKDNIHVAELAFAQGLKNTSSILMEQMNPRESLESALNKWRENPTEQATRWLDHVAQNPVLRKEDIVAKVFTETPVDLEDNTKQKKLLIQAAQLGCIALFTLMTAHVTQKERLLLYKEIAVRGDGSEGILADNFEELGIEEATAEERFALCKEIISGNFGPDTKNLIYKFVELGFEGITFNDRMSLCKDILSKVPNRALSADLFTKLDFVKDIRGQSDTKARLSFCKEFALQGPWFAESLVYDFNELGLDEASNVERLDLSKLIVMQGELPAAAVAANFNLLGLNKTSVSDRLLLCKEIVLRGECSASQLAENFDKLGLEEAQVNDRLLLCRDIALHGSFVVAHLAENFKALRLARASVDERLSLCKEIISRGDRHAAVCLCDNFGQLGLKGDEEIFSLASCIARYGYQDVFERVLDVLPDGSLCRQIYLDNLKPPLQSPLKYGWRINRKILPLVSILNKKAGDIPSADEIKALELFIEGNIQLKLLKPLIEDIKTKNLHLQGVLYPWIAYTAGVLLDLTTEQVALIEKSGILNDIYAHQNPSDRYDFMRQLSNLAQYAPDVLGALSAKERKWTRLVATLLAPLTSFGLEKEMVKQLLEHINDVKFKDPKRFATLVQLLLEVIAQGPYTKPQMASLSVALIGVLNRNEVSPGRKIVQISGDLEAYTNLFRIFGKEVFLQCLEKKQRPQEFIQAQFGKLFSLNNTEDFYNRYQKTFGVFRNQAALITYLRRVLSLSGLEKEKVLVALNDYVNSVLDGTFQQVRYQTEKSPHLAKVFASRSDIETLWRSSASPQTVSTTDVEEAKPIDYKGIFYRKIIVDKHLNALDFPRLKAFLEGGEQVIVQDSEEPLELFQNLAINLCNGNLQVQSFLKQIAELKNLLLGEFRNDLNALEQQAVVGTYAISESDDPCDLLLIGTEIKDSCQRVSGDPNLNKCLVGYLMNGEIKAIVVKQKDMIAARSMLRILWDEDKKSPVLLLERYYSNVKDPSIQKAILDWAIAKAKEMNLPLVSKEWDGNVSYEGRPKFLGGYAPFLYSDASEGVEAGPFIIENCQVQYLPEKADKK